MVVPRADSIHDLRGTPHILPSLLQWSCGLSSSFRCVSMPACSFVCNCPLASYDVQLYQSMSREQTCFRVVEGSTGCLVRGAARNTSAESGTLFRPHVQASRSRLKGTSPSVDSFCVYVLYIWSEPEHAGTFDEQPGTWRVNTCWVLHVA